MKIWIKRALRTFLQAALGFVSANALLYFTDINGSGYTAACGIATAAVAAGVAAVMNMKEDKV